MFRKIQNVLLLCLVLLPASFSLFAQEPAGENLFQKGLGAYQNKNYAEARDDFQKLISDNKISAPVLHNLALTYVQLNDEALALALWRKALSLTPGFEPAREGRSYLEAKLQVRGYEKDALSESIQNQMSFVSLYQTLWLIALALAASGFLWIRYASERRQALDEESALPAFPVAALALTLILAATIGLSLLKLDTASKTRATIVAKKTSARSLPTEEGVSLFELNGGNEVLVRRRDNEWSQVQNGEGSSGWVANKEIFITSQ